MLLLRPGHLTLISQELTLPSTQDSESLWVFLINISEESTRSSISLNVSSENNGEDCVLLYVRDDPPSSENFALGK